MPDSDLICTGGVIRRSRSRFAKWKQSWACWEPAPRGCGCAGFRSHTGKSERRWDPSGFTVGPGALASPKKRGVQGTRQPLPTPADVGKVKLNNRGV